MIYKRYKPLPPYLTIKPSNIHNLGLFATDFIQKGFYLGISHIEIDGLYRTPIGAFYNHSNEPNCIKVGINNEYHLKALRHIEKGEEITVKYTFYEI